MLEPGAGRGEGGIDLVDVERVVFEGEGEDAVLDGGGAVELKDAVGDLADERLFDGAGGLVVQVERSGVVVEDLSLCGSEYEGLAGEAMGDGVEAAAPFAFGVRGPVGPVRGVSIAMGSFGLMIVS